MKQAVREVAAKIGFNSFIGHLSIVAPMDEPTQIEAKGNRMILFSSMSVNKGIQAIFAIRSQMRICTRV